MKTLMKHGLVVISGACLCSACSLQDVDDSRHLCYGLPDDAHIVGNLDVDYFTPDTKDADEDLHTVGECSRDFPGCFSVPGLRDSYACSPCDMEWRLKCGAGGKCVDVKENKRHCGQCNHECLNEAECVDGACVCSKEVKASCTGKTPFFDEVECKCSDKEAKRCAYGEIFDTHENACVCNTSAEFELDEKSGKCVCRSGLIQNDDVCITPPKVTYDVGATFAFGRYKQKSDSSESSPIMWQVLKVDGAKVLVISVDALDVKPYNLEYNDITWEKSSIRSWLNGYSAEYNALMIDYTQSGFIDEAFSEKERIRIARANVTADKNTLYNVEAGNSTTDKIFLLSTNEARSYSTGNTQWLKAKASKYAVSQNALICGSSADCYVKWWLRSPGSVEFGASIVNVDGTIDESGSDANSGAIAVRPVFWMM